jgi:ribosomal protein L37E
VSIMATEHSDECRRCGRQTRDKAFTCEDCGDDLTRDLAENPWLTDQLDISITRQQSATVGTSSASVETGLPWHETASRAQRNLHATLKKWVRFCETEHIRNQAPTDTKPADNMPAMSRWLLWRVDGLLLHEQGHHAVDDIVKASAEARRIVLWKPKQRVYLAVCEETVEGVRCQGDVYADEGEDYGKCEDCGKVHEVAKRRLDLNKRLDDHLCSAADIARMAVFLGLQAKRDTVRNKVNVWHKRGRILPHAAAENGDPMFRYGEVRGMLAAAFEKDAKTGG